MGYPTSPVRLVDPGPKRKTANPIEVMDFAKQLAKEVRSGKMTADRASRELIMRLSYYKPDRIPSYSAKFIAAASDLIYSAELNSPAYHDPAEEEAHRILRDALKDVLSGKEKMP